MRHLVFVIFVFAALTPAQAADRPNVLFIAIDDLNDWVGCLGGHPQTRTPRIDALASRGMLFTNAHCQAPICNPSRVSLLLGQLPSTTGTYDLPQPHHINPRLEGAVTLPAHFRANGYHVMGTGKIYHGAYRYPQDFDEWESIPGTRRRARGRGDESVSGLPNIRIRDFGPVDLPDEDMGDMKIAEWGVERLGRAYDKPFFLALGIRLPHVPLYAPPKYFEPYPRDRVMLPDVRKDDLDDLPPAGLQITKYMDNTPLNHKVILEYDKWHDAVAAYLACVNFVDVCIGRIVDALDRSPHAKNTIIVVWSDHGWHLGEKRLWAKRSLWSESTRVPLIIAGPGVAQPNSRSNQPVGLIDLYPTLLELAGIPAPPQKIEGLSLVPLLRDPSAKRNQPVITTFNRGDHTIRSQRYRYIRYANGDEELYDNDHDPNEWYNLAADPRYAEIKRDHARWLPKFDAPDAPRIGKGGDE